MRREDLDRLLRGLQRLELQRRLLGRVHGLDGLLVEHFLGADASPLARHGGTCRRWQAAGP